MIVGEWLIFINALYNWLLLQFVETLFRERLNVVRKYIAVFCSAIVATIFINSSWVALCSFMIAICIAYGFNWHKLWRRGGVLFLASCLLGGILSVITPYFYSNPTLYFSTVVSIFLLYSLQRVWLHITNQRIQAHYASTVQVQFLGQLLKIRAFCDSGNNCVEPISGQPVHFLAVDALSNEKHGPFIQALQSWDAEKPFDISMFPLSYQPLLRFVRLQTIQASSTVLAFRMKQLTIGDITYENHYLVLTKDASRFPQQAKLILHCSVVPFQKGGE